MFGLVVAIGVVTIMNLVYFATLDHQQLFIVDLAATAAISVVAIAMAVFGQAPWGLAKWVIGLSAFVFVIGGGLGYLQINPIE